MWALGEAYPGDGVAHVPGWDAAVGGVLQAAEQQMARLEPRHVLALVHGIARVRWGRA